VVELYRGCEPLDDIEAMIRAAGDYVQASEDLRPRVLESARRQRCERRTQRWMGRLAMVVVLATVLTASERHRGGEARQTLASVAVYRASFPAPPAGSGDVSSDVGWGMVDAFTEMRRQQSQALRLSM
jgi:hypothetical protein